MKKTIIFLYLILVFTSCISKKAYKPEFIDDPITRVNIKELFSRADKINSSGDFLVLLKKTVYRLSLRNKLSIETHQVIKVLTDRKDGIGNSFIYFKNAYERISKIEAYTITKDNKKIKAKKVYTSAPFHNSYYNLGLYKNIRVKVISFSNIEKGSILNLRYILEVDHSDFGSFVEGVFYFNNPNHILRQKLVIILPKGKRIWFKSIKTAIRPRKFVSDKMDYYVLVRDNIKVISHKPFQISYKEVSPRLIFSTTHTWDELNTKLYSIISSGIYNNNMVTMTAKRLTKGISPEKKAEILYNFVTNTKNITNIAIPFGIRGYIPSSSAKVLALKYGDSLDKSILLVNLLRAVNINAKIAVTNELFDFDNDIPLLKGLNRVLVAVPKDKGYLFLDPYSALVPYGYLPAKVYGKIVLITGNKPVINRVPLISQNDNKIIYKTNSELMSNGVLKYKTNFITKGSYEVSERASIIGIKSKNTLKSLGHNYKSHYSFSRNTKLVNIKTSDPFDISNPFKYSVIFRVDLAKGKKNEIIVNPELQYNKLLPFSRSRAYDVDFILPFIVLSEHKIKYSYKWRIKSLPKSVRLTFPLWSYFREVRKRGGNFIFYKRKLELRVPRIFIGDYNRFREFIDLVIKADKQKIKFIKNR